MRIHERIVALRATAIGDLLALTVPFAIVASADATTEPPLGYYQQMAGTCTPSITCSQDRAIAGRKAPITTAPLPGAVGQTTPIAIKANGNPLGYYYTTLNTCQHDPYDYYHSGGFYTACQQARAVVSGANNACGELYVFGIALSSIAILYAWNAWATLALVSGLGLACVV